MHYNVMITHTVQWNRPYRPPLYIKTTWYNHCVPIVLGSLLLTFLKRSPHYYIKASFRGSRCRRVSLLHNNIIVLLLICACNEPHLRLYALYISELYITSMLGISLSVGHWALKTILYTMSCIPLWFPTSMWCTTDWDVSHSDIAGKAHHVSQQSLYSY